MRPVSVVIIGAGSASFGLNALATLLREPVLRGSSLALVDTNVEGLQLVRALAERMNREWDAGLTITSTPDRVGVLPGADFVVTTIEVGPREDLWREDWEVTRRHGLRQPYAENGGPGGFAHAARNIPPILDIARDMERLCPRALLINLSNPLPRLCRAVTRYTGIRTLGLCHQIGHGYRMAGLLLADRLGIEVSEELSGAHIGDDALWPGFERIGLQTEALIQITAAGLNHFTWMLDVRDRRSGEDLYPELRARFLAGPAAFEPLTRDMLRLSGVLPVPGDMHLCEYLPFTHNAATEPWKRYDLHLYDWDGRARKREEGWTAIAAMAKADGPSLDSLREARSEGMFEAIYGIAGSANVFREAFDVTNDGAITNLPAHVIVETPGIFGGPGAQPLRVGALPPVAAELCRREAECVELAVEAAVTGSRDVALQALALDPMVDDLDMARAILDDYLETHRATLPQFHGRWHFER
jgi:alpha-galactosidase